PTAAGVAFTLNPTDGDRSQIAIEASFGLGEAVVSGEVTPDNFMVDKVLLEIHQRTISPKHVELMRLEDGSGVVWRDVEPERQGQPSVSDVEVLGVARMAKAVERHFGSPQDIEWAIDRHLPEGHNVVLLQSRPETVWSRRPRRIVSGPESNFMDGIVSTLLSPVHTRGKGAASTESGSGRQEARE
ncbi:MAG: PEP/pyruvate-binding domain-containing protein, partial [Acidimicrobiia bacterium]